MADGTHIEWTDATWNPTVGCSILTPGCTHCYAMQMAARIEAINAADGKPTHYAGTTRKVKGKAVWTGKMALAPEHILTQPLRWKKPRRIFVNSMSDLFHEDVPDGWIMAVFDVMWRTPWHTYQVLTKRGARMCSFVEKWCDLSGEDFAAFKNARGPDATRKAHPSGRGQLFAAYLDTLLERSGSKVPNGAAWPTFDWMQGMMWWPKVPPNVWLGVSAEDQVRADERIPDLLATPAAVRFVSAEPLLGPIDLLGTLARWQDNPARRSAVPLGRQLIDWIIVGGESGRGARPMHPAWARSIRDQCAAAGVAFHFKQWGAWEPHKPKWGGDLGGDVRAGRVRIVHASGRSDVEVSEATGGRSTEAGSRYMEKVGKKAAGRLLDGVQHNGFPESFNAQA